MVCDNCNKRKEGPRKAIGQIETASNHFKNAREKDLASLESERERIRFDKAKVCNCASLPLSTGADPDHLHIGTIPDKDTVAAQWGEALTTIDRLATVSPLSPTLTQADMSYRHCLPCQGR